MPHLDNIRKDILVEAHSTPYSIHVGATKMYKDLKICDNYLFRIKNHNTWSSVVLVSFNAYVNCVRYIELLIWAIKKTKKQ